MLADLDVDGRLAAEGAHQEAAIRVMLGLLGRQNAFFDLHRHPGVIASELARPAASDQVAPAVADVADRQVAALDHHHDDGAAHAGARDVLFGTVEDDAVRGGDGVANRVGRRCAVLTVEGGFDRLDGEAAGDFAGGVAAHPVRDDQQRALGSRLR